MSSQSLSSPSLDAIPSVEKDFPASARDTTQHDSLAPVLTATTVSSTLKNSPSNSSSVRPPPRRSTSVDTLSLFSADDFHELRTTVSSTAPGPQQTQYDVPESHIAVGKPPPSRLRRLWIRNKGLALVAVAQLFGTLMNITTRLLELEGNNGQGMHPFQILFARMSITYTLCMLYMWYQKIPDFPFGARGIRLLLVTRGVGGFFGVFGLYWSLQYLPLSDATVLTFLAPSLASYLCSKLIKEPFTRVEQIGGLISFIGVILIARPTYFFASSSPSSSPSPADSETDPGATTTAAGFTQEASPSQRLEAVGMAMVGVFGATCAYTTIRWIGKRAHPLISVNYFAAWCTLVSTVALAFVPGIPFVLPSTPKEWMLLFFIGVSGFVMQFLLTAGLRYEKSSRATNMVYTQLLFALAGDKLVFGGTPGVWSLAGSALILGSALVVAVQKEAAAVAAGKQEVGGVNRAPSSGTATSRNADEEMGLVSSHEDLPDDEESDTDKGGDFEEQARRCRYDVRADNNDDEHEAAATGAAMEMHEIRRLTDRESDPVVRGAGL